MLYRAELELLMLFVQKPPLAGQPFLEKPRRDQWENNWHSKPNKIARIDKASGKGPIERV